MEDLNLRITLTEDDWDQDVGGWRCPALKIPGAEVAAVFWLGREVPQTWYAILPAISVLKWSHQEIPKQVAVSIALTKQLSTEELTLWWKKFGIVVPIITVVLASLISLIGSRRSRSLDQPTADERAAVIQQFYDHLNNQKYEDAWALIHPLRKAQIQQRVKDANDFSHVHIKTALETDDATEPTYVVGFDVRDDVPRSVIYQLSEQQVEESVKNGIINQNKVVDLVFANLNDYFDLSDADRRKIRERLGKRRLSSLFSPVFVEEFASELGLEQHRRSTLPLKDSIWRHFILRLTLRKDEYSWKIRSGLDKPLIAEYGPGASVLIK